MEKQNEKQSKKVVEKLSPSQQEVFDRVTRRLPEASVFVVWTPTGIGRTTILRRLHHQTGGAFIELRELLDTLGDRHPLAVEETLQRLLLRALADNPAVYVDDIDVLSGLGSCSNAYPRAGLLEAPLQAACVVAQESGRKLFFGTKGAAPAPVHQRALYAGLKGFSVADFQFFLAHAGIPRAETFDVAKIHRFASRLNAHQLLSSAAEARLDGNMTTDTFIDFLRAHHMLSNVDIGEVQAVDLSKLRGVDDILASLEANIILPFENDALATELGIKPKRGVLIVGPPGTGKTTIGRALAHRLRSKFFLIDGTFIVGTSSFYGRISQVFAAAKQNAPSVIFIDDSDVIFEDGREHGLYRFLLTMMDGLESASIGRVCVMMTAMDVAALPPALVRSGRIELWLETRLPDEQARLQILQDLTAALPAALTDLDLPRLAPASEGLTGADLKRVVDDAKILYAFDRSKGRPARTTTDYFLSAIDSVRANKARYADAEARTREAARGAPAGRSPYYLHSVAEEDASPPA